MKDRDAVCAQVLTEELAAQPPMGPVLLIDQTDGRVMRAVADTAGGACRWFGRSFDGAKAKPWPPEGQVSTVLLRLPRERARLNMILHAAAQRLVVGGELWIVGANDEGIKSTPKRLSPLFESVETRAFRRHVRVLAARRSAEGPAPTALEGWQVQTPVELPGAAGPRTLISYPGLFAKGALDPATALLLQHLDVASLAGPVLDYGCGPGAISMALRAQRPGLELCMLDVDALAIHAAQQNVPDALHWCGDGWAGVANDVRFGAIVSNPPLHRGKDMDLRAYEALLAGAAARLSHGGRLVIVSLRSATPLKRMKKTFGNARLLAEDHRFHVVESVRPKGTPKRPRR